MLLRIHLVACVTTVWLWVCQGQVTAPPQYNGPKGEKGSAGDIGATGFRGATGLKGFPGATGVRGANGQKGDKGVAGISAPSAGAIGSTGTAGSQGEEGSVGLPGNKGLKGDEGSPGSSGAKGEKGNVGAPGVPGAQGSMGQQGARGQQGDQGFRGAKGEKGEPGEEGLRGPTGPDGDLGYPFGYSAAQYSAGCLELEGYAGKDCGSTHYCQDVVDSNTDIVTGHCRCLEGYNLDNNECKNTLYAAGAKDCSVNNGGCEQTCSNGACQCRDGYTLRSTGACLDVNECAEGIHKCSTSHECLNTIGSYKCLQDPGKFITEATIVGSGLVNGNLLLALLVWFLIIFLIIFILLVAICCLKPIKRSAPTQITSTSVEYIHPKIRQVN